MYTFFLNKLFLLDFYQNRTILKGYNLFIPPLRIFLLFNYYVNF